MHTKDGTIVDRREMLRVKLKSLAVEAKIIRQEEDKVRPKSSLLRTELREHRVGAVRKEARASSLAYGFIKGYKRTQIEVSFRQLPDVLDKELRGKVIAMVKRYGPVQGGDVSGPIAQWWSERL